MEETTLQWIASLKLLFISIAAILYGFGGISGKWKRRYISSIVISIGVWTTSLLVGTFSFWYLLYYPLLVGGVSNGYGVSPYKVSFMKWANSNGEANKYVKRAIWALGVCMASAPIAVITQAWQMWGLQLIVLLLVSVSLGVLNFAQNARNEETIIGVSAYWLPIYMV